MARPGSVRAPDELCERVAIAFKPPVVVVLADPGPGASHLSVLRGAWERYEKANRLKRVCARKIASSQLE